MYKTTKWQQKRLKILKRDKYKCKYCFMFGKSTQADMVHHIFTYEEYPEYAFTDDNLISLCNKCHNKMHVRKSHKLTEVGRSLQPPLFYKLKAKP